MRSGKSKAQIGCCSMKQTQFLFLVSRADWSWGDHRPQKAMRGTGSEIRDEKVACLSSVRIVSAG